MADQTPGFKAGEYTDQTILAACSLKSGVTFAAGDLVKITGFESDGTPIVDKLATNNATDEPRGVIVRQDNTEGGKRSTMAIFGHICVPVGGATTAGLKLSQKNGKVVPTGTSGESNFKIGYAMGVAAAANDTILIWFQPGLQLTN